MSDDAEYLANYRANQFYTNPGTARLRPMSCWTAFGKARRLQSALMATVLDRRCRGSGLAPQGLLRNR